VIQYLVILMFEM